MECIAQQKVFGGTISRYRHESISTNTDMVFAIFLPSDADKKPVPVLYWLSGLTCTDENFCHKAGAFKTAAELGVAIVCPDTSPRGLNLPGEHDSYDLGSGAGFYINATQPPWSDHYHMYSYVIDELPALIENDFPVTDKKAIFGHSMGGHGALMIALRNPDQFVSVSAFAPIVHPTQVPWGQKAFRHYLGDDEESWKQYDSTLLIKQTKKPLPILIDQGDKDQFLQEQLKPELFQKACNEAGHTLRLRMHSGYDHSYYFIASFIDDHFRFHAQQLFN